jgi:mannan endo-1,4-beta-mannosidase
VINALDVLFLADLCLAEGIQSYKFAGEIGVRHVLLLHIGAADAAVAGIFVGDRASLIQFHDNGGDNQHWRIIQVSPKQYKFINVHSGKALDIASANTADGVHLIQCTYNGNSNQMWSFTPTGDGYCKFSPGSNAAASLQAAAESTADGAIVEQWAWTGKETQEWNIVPAYTVLP